MEGFGGGQGASSDDDRAAHEQSPAVSAVPVGIPSAIKRVLDPHFDHAEKGMYGDRADFLAWRNVRRTIPDQIVEAIYEAGFILTRLGGSVETDVRLIDGGNPFHTEVRAQMEMPRVIAYAEQRVPAEYLKQERYLQDYLPRQLADTMWSVFRDQVTIALARTIKSKLSAQAIEARRAATTGAVEDESAVTGGDAP